MTFAHCGKCGIGDKKEGKAIECPHAKKEDKEKCKAKDHANCPFCNKNKKDTGDSHHTHLSPKKKQSVISTSSQSTNHPAKKEATNESKNSKQETKEEKTKVSKK